MKFFTRELWLSAQKLGNLKTYDEQWQKAFDEYRDQLETLRGRLNESAFRFFSEADVHDGELLDLAIADGSRPARLSEPVRVWKRSGDNPVRARLTVLDSYDHGNPLIRI